MAILNFKKSFADKILDRTKHQTIRGLRKYPIKVGETLYLYCGLRTKYTVKLGEAVCMESVKININNKGIKQRNEKRITDEQHLNAFAILDGFESWQQMKRWWKQTHGDDCFPFNGTITYWKDFTPAQKTTKPTK